MYLTNKELVEAYGDSNDIPKDFQETSSSVWHNFYNYIPDGIMHKRLEIDNKWIEVICYCFLGNPDMNFAFEKTYNNTPPKKFYVFSGKDECLHEWGDDINIGRCYNKQICKKCGFERRVDSSD